MSRKKFDVRYKGLLSMGYEAKDISNRDLDDMFFSGVFYGFNVINAPDINYVQIIITRHNEGWVVQECKDYIDRLYLRSFKDGKWGEWTQLVVAHNCDKPEQEIVIVERPHSHQIATMENHGFMSAEDKRILDKFSKYTKGHNHPEYEENIIAIRDRVDEFDNSKANIDHNHDDRYLTAFSNNMPKGQNLKGQVWIQLNE